MLTSIIAYLMVAAPSIVAIASILFVVIAYVNKIRINLAEANRIVAESKEINEEMKECPEWKVLIQLLQAENAEERKAIRELIKTLTENTEILTRIRQQHPEWFNEGGE